MATGSHRSITSGARICSRQAVSEEVREQFKALVYCPGHDAVTVWSRSSSLSNGHWMQQSQRICYHVFDQVEPTRSPWPRLFRPSTPSNARRRGRARVQKLLKGGLNADPFVIARASVENRTVVTMEKLKATAAKIPNICCHFGISCLSLEEFMEAENWRF